jgi:hypothetical protein
VIPDIKIAIATNIKFYEKTLPIIIPSLLNCGINKEDIYIFNSGFNEFKHEINDGINHYYLDFNSYEYSALIEISEKELKSDYWFLIHDTCKVGEKFKELLYNIPNNKPVKIALKSKPSMSIGLYDYNYLLQQREKLITIKNYDYSEPTLKKWKFWGVANEDFILWMTEPAPLIYNNTDKWFVVDNDNWFDTNTIRRTEYYPSLDIYKNKSNWGQTGINMVIDI